MMLCLAGTVAPATAEQIAVVGIEARLFYGQTATFSKNVIGDPHFLLRNVPVGGGSAEGPSTATLLVVEVSGPPGQYLPGRQVLASARWERTETTPKGKSRPVAAMLDAAAELGSFGTDGRGHVGFWLQGTACSPVTVSIRLRSGATTGAPLDATIPFTCGE